MSDEQPRRRRSRNLGQPTYSPEPGSVPPPGETLQEWLEENGHTQVWLANRLNLSTKHVNRIINGHTLYSADLALRLAQVTGISARFWMHLQADYQINVARAETSGDSATRREGSGDA